MLGVNKKIKKSIKPRKLKKPNLKKNRLELKKPTRILKKPIGSVLVL
jgi:hypothetical protein